MTSNCTDPEDDCCTDEQSREVATVQSEDLHFLPTLHGCHPSQCVHRHWVQATTALRSGITRTIVAIAVHAARYPCLWIVTILGLSAAMLAAGIQTNFKLELDMMNIFTPTSSIAETHRGWALYDSGLSGYVKTNVPFRMVVHRNGGNVITYEGVERAFEVFQMATAIRVIDDVCSEYDRLEIDLDAGYTGHCDFQAITRFWDHNQTRFEREVPEGDDITRFLLNTTYPDGTTVDIEQIFGNVQVQDDGIPLSAEALFVEIGAPFNKWLWHDLFSYADQLSAASADLKKTWADSGETDYVVEFVFNYNVGKEFEEVIFRDFPLLPFVFTVMLAFCCFVFWKRHRVQSRLLLALGAVLTVVLSMATGFGMMFLIGVPYTIVTNILPFVIFGVGLDDTFIIYLAFERTDPKKDIVDRIREVFEECGLSITMTTLTTSLAFGLGCISTIPAIRDLCYYAFPTILIDGLYQVSFFVSLVVLDERRIQANRVDCCPCVVAPADGTSSDASIVSTDSSNASQNNNGSDDDKQARYSASLSSGKSKTESKQDAVGESETKVCRSARIMGWYADQLRRPWVKAAVLLGFAGFFAACVYSATKLKQDFSFFDLLPSDSPTKAYLTSLENYGGVNGDINLFFRGLNQSDVDIQDKMIDYINQIDDIPHVDIKPFCWVKDFKMLMEDPDSFVTSLMEDPTAARVLEEYPEVTQFLQSEVASSTIDGLTFDQLLNFMFSQPMVEKLYSAHIRRNRNGDILASRCVVELKNLDYNSVEDQVEILRAQNEVTNNHPLNQIPGSQFTHHAFLYKDLFQLWEFFDVAMSELRYTAVVGIATVTVFSFLFIPHWSGVFYVLPFMCVLYIDLLGLFHMLGLTVNVLTYVTLVVSVGLLVDFLMHILLRYFESTKETREERVKDTLMTMGASILLGGLSTFLGSIPLAFSQSAVFRTLYIAFFSMIFLGVTHGLVLLPVVLSMFGAKNPTSMTTICQTNAPQHINAVRSTQSQSLINAVLSSFSQTKTRNEDEDEQTQRSSGSSHQDSPTNASFPTSFEIRTDTSPPASSSRVADYDHEGEFCSVDLVVRHSPSSSAHDQFEISIV